MQNRRIGNPPEAYIIIVLAIIVTLLMASQVVGRYVFGNAISWSEEAVRYLFLWIIMIGASYATRDRANISIDILDKLLKGKIRLAVNALAVIIWLAICIYVCFISFQYMLFIKQAGATSTVLRIPLWTINLAIPVGFFLISVRIIINYIVDYKEVFKNYGRKNEDGNIEKRRSENEFSNIS